MRRPIYKTAKRVQQETRWGVLFLITPSLSAVQQGTNPPGNQCR